MTELVVRQEPIGSTLAITADQHYWTAPQLAGLKQLGIDKAEPGDLAVFFHQAQRTGLDPFAKQLYMIGRVSKEKDDRGNWHEVTKYTIQTGIDGYRLVARRAVDRARETLSYGDTLWCGPDGQWRDVWLSEDHPSAAKVTVLRNGQPFSAVALWDEYVQTKKDYKTGEIGPNSMWSKMGANQLAKCAEALALRKAFPQDLSGIYTTDEMGQVENDQPAAPRAIPEKLPSIQDAIAEREVVAAVWDATPTEPAPDHYPSAGYDAAKDPRTDKQSKKLHALLRETGLGNREEGLAYLSRELKREIASTSDLTVLEASQVIDTLAGLASVGADHQGVVHEVAR